MARTAKWVRRAAVSASALTLIGLVACDRQQERLDRIGDLSDAVIGQLGGEDVTRSNDNRYASVPVEARAFAGTILERSAAVSDEPATPRFVIGSIVAKPASLPDSVEFSEVMAEPEKSLDVVVDEQSEARIIIPDERTIDQAVQDPDVIRRIEFPESKKRSITVVDPESRAQTRSIGTNEPALPRAPLKDTVDQKRYERGVTQQPVVRSRSLAIQLPATPEERMAQLPKLNPKVARRALIQPNAALQRQLVAEERMIQAASKFKVAASIQRSRSGQMVIEIGSDALNPTNFTEAVLQQGRIALENGVECDEVAAQQSDANPLVAMECVIEDLKSSGEFEYVEKDWLYEHQMIRRPGQEPTPTLVTPNDPLFGLQWHYKSQGTEAGQSAGGAGFVDFWTEQASQGSSEVVVAVVDTGLQMDHPDIQSSVNVVDGWDMVSDLDVANDGNGRDDDPNDPGDVCPQAGVLSNTYHGTHVAGIIGAASTNNADGVAGGAWNVKVVPVRALGKCGGKLSDINDAIRWAAGTIPEFNELGEEVWNEHPADIINLSLGLFKTCPASMQDAINSVTEQGVVVVVAAGNRSVPTEFFAPAGCENVVTVAGGDARGFLAPYSNYGAAVDVLAPGGDLTRDDDGDGNPDGVLSTKTAENCEDPLTGSAVETCYYAYEQGTSMATPHVAAALALIKSKRPDYSSDQLVSTLMSGVSSIPENQCTGLCAQFPGAVPTADDPDMCLRPCGSGLLNLADVTLAD
ncbi:MAG: S8 family serine peptidase [Pseudomonadota bacterium]|nr:S8 family serine peptidase [Pseudomonadota bacterium]